jgi:hypothetical protein
MPADQQRKGPASKDLLAVTERVTAAFHRGDDWLTKVEVRWNRAKAQGVDVANDDGYMRWHDAVAKSYTAFGGVDLKAKTSPIEQYTANLAPEANEVRLDRGEKPQDPWFVFMYAEGEHIPTAAIVPMHLRLFEDAWAEDKLPEVLSEKCASDLGLLAIGGDIGL